MPIRLRFLPLVLAVLGAMLVVGASPEGVAGIEALSLIPVGGTAEAFDKALRRDLARWADVVKATGVKGD